MKNTSPNKTDTLRHYRCLNPHPQRVCDEHFLHHPFFDPNDLMQVKYEMLRRVRKHGDNVRDSARRYGLSRPTFYNAQQAWQEGGLVALVPAKPGSNKPRKLTEEMIEYLQQELEQDRSMRTDRLQELLQQRFQLHVHRTTIERALARSKKNSSERAP